MTPTREQVTAAFIAEFEPTGFQMDLAKCHCCTFSNERTQDAFMGFTAGRDQGLREAALICRVTPPEPFRPSIEAAHAIEQLRGK